MKTLVTGGAGFIGSTIASACLDAGLTPVILDDLSTGRIEFARDRDFYQGDIADGELLDRIFTEHPDISSVVHCAGRVAVPESLLDPLGYYRSNVSKTVDLLAHAIRNGCGRLLFSSSASMYSPGREPSVDERSAVDPQSPYARTKVMVEEILRDAAAVYPIRVLSLRYFNPIGADPQLRTGPQASPPLNAIGQLLMAHERKLPFIVKGTDWATTDGSALRDYVHVWDIARAHVIALEKFDDVLPHPAGYDVLNLGSGIGTTVRELIAAFQAVAGCAIVTREGQRRPGDTVGCHARCDKATSLLGWTAEYSVMDAIQHSLAWQQRRRDVLGPG